jgi:hypothetical protein
LPKHKENFAIRLPVDSALKLCWRVVATDDWDLIEQHGDGLTCKESFQLSSIYWPVTVSIALLSEGDRTVVVLHGSNGGLGPIQSRHVKVRVSGLRGLIETTASRPRQGQAMAQASEMSNEGTSHDAAAGRYCSKCGAALPADANFCVSCGANLRSLGGIPSKAKPRTR